MKVKSFFLILTGLFMSIVINAQEMRNLSQLLGYPKDSKLLIIHADDMGMSHSVNMAVMKAFENKSITSGSIMVPCPWALEIAAGTISKGIYFLDSARCC